MRQNGILEELLLVVDAPPETQLKVAGEDLLRQRLSAVHEEVTEMAIQGEPLTDIPQILDPMGIWPSAVRIFFQNGPAFKIRVATFNTCYQK